MADEGPGRAALAGLEHVWASRPEADGHVLAEVARNLCALRDTMIARGERAKLEHVNAVLSVVLAVHFPLGPIPWDEVDKARAWLADAVDAMEPA